LSDFEVFIVIRHVWLSQTAMYCVNKIFTARWECLKLNDWTCYVGLNLIDFNCSNQKSIKAKCPLQLSARPFDVFFFTFLLKTQKVGGARVIGDLINSLLVKIVLILSMFSLLPKET
jgi:hypothetical protein